MSFTAAAGRPEISVLMSCYNCERWLPDAIDSVLAQSFRKFELILVDDGSVDNTWQIIKSYDSRDDRVVAITKENTGLTDSLNVGVAQARGRWIARLDADDVSESTRLEEQLDFADKNPGVVLLGSGFVEIDDQGIQIRQHYYPAGHRRLVRRLENLHRFFPHSSAMFRRDIAEQWKFYNSLFQKTQDWDLWLRLSELGQIACLKNSLVRIRRHSHQISKSVSGVSQLTYGTVAIICHFLRQQHHPDPSTSIDSHAWKELISWVDRRIREEGILEMRDSRARARAECLSGRKDVSALFRFAARLMSSGYGGASVREWIFGSSLPRRLTNEWGRRSTPSSKALSG